MISAFGIEHGYDSLGKADTGGSQPKASGGRYATAIGLGPYHSLVAGRKGKKLRATGNTVAGGIGGSAAGALGGALLTRGRSFGAAYGASLAGSAAGVGAATHRNQRRGYYKPQKG